MSDKNKKNEKDGLQPGYDYCIKIMFPALERARKIAGHVQGRLDAGEKLADIHADMRGKYV